MPFGFSMYIESFWLDEMEHMTQSLSPLVLERRLIMVFALTGFSVPSRFLASPVTYAGGGVNSSTSNTVGVSDPKTLRFLPNIQSRAVG